MSLSQSKKVIMVNKDNRKLAYVNPALAYSTTNNVMHALIALQ